MKLFYSPNSPFARKCRIVMLEKGLEDKVELIIADPMQHSDELLAATPLGTIPALITDDGLHICDSTLICEYLDAQSSGTTLHPMDESRMCVMAMAVMADGIMNAAVTCVLEGRRPKEMQYTPWVERKEAAMMRTIAKFAAIPMEQSSFSIGIINLAVALDYVSFRHPHLNWRSEHPKLANWLDEFTKRPSFQTTQPKL